VPIRDGTGYAGKRFMKIAALKDGPSQIPIRTAKARDKDTPPPRGRGKVRHVLHGWRVLMAPLVTQVLAIAGPGDGRVPVEHALDAYHRRQDPEPWLRPLLKI
jgi:hypothetical protein